MSARTKANANVTGDEIEEWVTLIREHHDDPEHQDIAGGLAPTTINEFVERERSISTYHRHLRRDDRVRQVEGVHISPGDGGGPRWSYVPSEVEG